MQNQKQDVLDLVGKIIHPDSIIRETCIKAVEITDLCPDRMHKELGSRAVLLYGHHYRTHELVAFVRLTDCERLGSFMQIQVTLDDVPIFRPEGEKWTDQERLRRLKTHWGLLSPETLLQLIREHQPKTN